MVSECSKWYKIRWLRPCVSKYEQLIRCQCASMIVFVSHRAFQVLSWLQWNEKGDDAGMHKSPSWGAYPSPVTFQQLGEEDQNPCWLPIEVSTWEWWNINILLSEHANSNQNSSQWTLSFAALDYKREVIIVPWARTSVSGFVLSWSICSTLCSSSSPWSTTQHCLMHLSAAVVLKWRHIVAMLSWQAQLQHTTCMLSSNTNGCEWTWHTTPPSHDGHAPLTLKTVSSVRLKERVEIVRCFVCLFSCLWVYLGLNITNHLNIRISKPKRF